MRKTVQDQYVYSKPTMCLHCHLVVEMVHEREADPQKGAWTCPQCGHLYPFNIGRSGRQPHERQKPLNSARIASPSGLQTRYKMSKLFFVNIPTTAPTTSCRNGWSRVESRRDPFALSGILSPACRRLSVTSNSTTIRKFPKQSRH